MKLSALVVVLGVSGCESITPLVEVSHTSHITQHFGNNQTNYGWNTFSAGLRFRSPDSKVVLDVLDGYSPEELDGKHEVFTARLQIELGK